MNQVKGRVLNVDTQLGSTEKGEWKRVTIVVETASKRNNTVPVGFFNPEFNLPDVGTEVEIDFFVGGREWEGKYYAQIDGSQLRVVGGNQISKPKHPMVSQSFDDITEDDSLPF